MKAVFLHGLDSSSKGTKARWFKERFPGMLIPDFSGPLEDRMRTLSEVLAGQKGLVIVGSSFGGLMAAVFVLYNESRVKRLILLRLFMFMPALNLISSIISRRHSGGYGWNTTASGKIPVINI